MSDPTTASYVSTAEKLVERIVTLAATQPEILTLETPWGLFKVPGFKCDDIGPSLGQASWALREAQHRLKRAQS